MKLRDVLYPFLKRSGRGYTSCSKPGIIIKDEITHGIFNTTVYCTFFHDNEDGKIKVNGKVKSPWFRFFGHPGNDPFEPKGLDDPPSLHIDSEVVFMDGNRFKVLPEENAERDSWLGCISGDNHIFSIISTKSVRLV
jgi:hypothetical protein